MDRSQRPSPAHVAQRVAARSARYLRRDPLVLVALVVLPLLLALGFSGALVPAEASPMSSDAAEQYMRALRDRDAALMFESLSPELRRRLETGARLQGPAAAAAVLQLQEQSGDRILDYHLVGRYETDDGQQLNFFVARAQNGPERQTVPYIITVGPHGKVAKIE